MKILSRCRCVEVSRSLQFDGGNAGIILVIISNKCCKVISDIANVFILAVQHFDDESTYKAATCGMRTTKPSLSSEIQKIFMKTM